MRAGAEQTLATTWVEPARDIAPIRSLGVEGDPRKVLLQAADDEDADLLVVGAAGVGSSPGFLHLGSVAEFLVHQSTRPIAVIPTEVRGPVAQILLGVHGSASDDAVVRWTADVAAGAEVAVLAVTVQPGDGDRQAIERRIRQWIQPIGCTGVELRAIGIVDSSPADGLLRAADRHRADVVAVGMRPVGMVSGQRAGGTAIKLLHHAKVAIILVPADWKASGDATA